MSLEALRERLRDAHARFTSALAGLDRAVLESEPATGTWTARDVAAHLADWNEEILLAAAHLLGGPKPTHHPVVDFEAYNTAHAALHAGEAWAVAMQRLDDTVARAIEVAGRFADRLEEAVEHPWNNRGTIRDLFHGVCGHEEEHAEMLEAWRTARAGS